VTQPVGVDFNFGSAVVKGPDEKAWVRMHFNYGILSSFIQLPEQLATEFLQAFTAQLHNTCVEARRANLGLLLPGNVQFAPPKNGDPRDRQH